MAFKPPLMISLTFNELPWGPSTASKPSLPTEEMGKGRFAPGQETSAMFVKEASEVSQLGDYSLILTPPMDLKPEQCAGSLEQTFIGSCLNQEPNPGSLSQVQPQTLQLKCFQSKRNGHKSKSKRCKAACCRRGLGGWFSHHGCPEAHSCLCL